MQITNFVRMTVAIISSALMMFNLGCSAGKSAKEPGYRVEWSSPEPSVVNADIQYSIGARVVGPNRIQVVVSMRSFDVDRIERVASSLAYKERSNPSSAFVVSTCRDAVAINTSPSSEMSYDSETVYPRRISKDVSGRQSVEVYLYDVRLNSAMDVDCVEVDLTKDFCEYMRVVGCGRLVKWGVVYLDRGDVRD